MRTKSGVKTKASGKIACSRRIFVSSLEKAEDNDNQRWASELFDLAEGLAGEEQGFATAMRTSDIRGPKGVVVPEEWVKALRGKGKYHTLIARPYVTDIIGVCSVKYLNSNMKKKAGEQPHELREFIDEIKLSAALDCVRVWLAPIEKTLWGSYRICEVNLADEKQEHRSWLIRLKKDGERYRLPGELGPAWKDDLYSIVEKVIDKIR